MTFDNNPHEDFRNEYNQRIFGIERSLDRVDAFVRQCNSPSQIPHLLMRNIRHHLEEIRSTYIQAESALAAGHDVRIVFVDERSNGYYNLLYLGSLPPALVMKGQVNYIRALKSEGFDRERAKCESFQRPEMKYRFMVKELCTRFSINMHTNQEDAQ